MASKPTVTLTLAGDADKLVKAFKETDDAAERTAKEARDAGEQIDKALREVGDGADQAAQRVRDAGGRMDKAFDEAGDSARRGGQQVADGFDRAGEAADVADTRAMGFRDGLTGVEDSMAGVAALAKGDLFQGLYLTGAGFGDLASATANLAVPALAKFNAMSLATKRALGIVGVALAAATAAYFLFRDGTEEASEEVIDLSRDVDVFIRSGGRLTGHFKDLVAETGGLSTNLDILDRDVLSYADSVSFLDSLLGRSSVSEWAEQNEKARGEIEKIDQALASAIEQGYSYEAVLAAANEALGEQAVSTALAAGELDDFQDVARAAEERQRALGRSTAETADEYREAHRQLETYANLLRAQTDPMFAFLDAQDQVTDAQTALNEVLNDGSATARDVEQAQRTLTQAELNLIDATAGLAAVNERELLRTLKQLRDDGQLSQQAFDNLRGTLGLTQQAVDNLDGSRARVYVDVIQTVHGPGVRMGGGTLLEFHDGGVVPGPRGQEVAAILQAGERVIPLDEVDAYGRPTTGTIAYYYTGDINVTVPVKDLDELTTVRRFADRLRNDRRRELVSA